MSIAIAVCAGFAFLAVFSVANAWHSVRIAQVKARSIDDSAKLSKQIADLEVNVRKLSAKTELQSGRRR